jgi:hypothetical protein
MTLWAKSNAALMGREGDFLVLEVGMVWESDTGLCQINPKSASVARSISFFWLF